MSGPKPARAGVASVRGSSSGIDVEADQASAGLQPLEDRAGVTAAAERAVDARRRRAAARRQRSISATMIGRCMPAGVLPASSTFCTSAA